MTFEEFFKKKKIDLAALHLAEPSLFSEFKGHFEQMGEKSFDHTKKYWFNKLRLKYHLAPEIKADKVVIENKLAEQTITEKLVETADEPAKPAVGFKPRFKAGAVKQVADNSLTKPAEGDSAPRISEDVTTNVAQDSPVQESNTPSTPPPSKVGFKPRFKANVTKTLDDAGSNVKDLPTEKSATVTPEVNKAAEIKDQSPAFEEEKEAMQQQADEMERTATQDTPIDEPTQTPASGKPAYKPRFKMKKD